MFKSDAYEYQDITIKNDSFWPDLNIGEFQRRRSIPVDIDAETIAASILAAVGEINADLGSFVTIQRQAGYTAASEVPGASVESENLLTVQYKKAVFARAKADLIGEYASLSRRETHIGQDSPDTRAELLAEAAFVLRNIQGYPRVGVALI